MHGVGGCTKLGSSSHRMARSTFKGRVLRRSSTRASTASRMVPAKVCSGCFRLRPIPRSLSVASSTDAGSSEAATPLAARA
eukprot:212284-Prymnesium_polylepis.1